MSKTVFMDDLARVHVLDVARRVGGKSRLREHSTVFISLDDAAPSVDVHLEHRACWRGGRQSYFICPTCGSAALILLFDPMTSRLRCRSDWPELRYRSQERGQRRGDVIANAVST